MSLVSVIIPTYNAELTIRETIESVLAQTFSDFEIVAIDDGSQDSTVEVVDSIRDSRIKIFSFLNAGVATARNRGIEKATGKYLAFLDADDLWTADKLESQIQALKNNPEAFVAYSWTDYIDENGKFLHAGERISANGNVYACLLVSNFLENGSNPLIRREAFATVGNFDKSFPPAEDWELYLRLAARYNFAVVPSVQVLYRVRANSLSGSVLKQEEQCLKVIKKTFSQAPENLQSLKVKSFAHLYEYLLFRTLEGSLTRKKSWISARYFTLALRYNPQLLGQRSRLMSIVFLKIWLGLILPPQQLQTFLTIVKSRSNP